MEKFVRILRTILISLVTAISGLLCLLIGWRRWGYYFVSRYFWSPAILWIAGIKVEKIGFEVEDLPPCVFYANHRSHFDIPALMYTVPRPLYFMAKKELKSVPFLGWGMMAVGMIFIDRQNRNAAIQSMDKAGRDIRRGKSIVSFPEGTRSGSNALLPFKKGTFHLAKSQGIHLLPVAISGSEKVLPKHGKLRSGIIRLKMGTPIGPEKMNALTVEGLRDFASSHLEELLGELENPESIRESA
jgi:1-acyl-sn-glycerol-3-phosphate acyltransferase